MKRATTKFRYCAKASEVAQWRNRAEVSASSQRLRRLQVDTIDVIDDIEAIDHIEPRTKAEVARKRKRAEVSGMRMQAFRVSGLGQMGLIGLIRRGQRRGFEKNGGRKWLAYSLCGLTMGRYSELQAKKRGFRDDRADHRHALRHYCAPSARWAVMRQW